MFRTTEEPLMRTLSIVSNSTLLALRPLRIRMGPAAQEWTIVTARNVK